MNGIFKTHFKMTNRNPSVLLAVLYAGLMIQFASSSSTHRQRSTGSSSSLPADLPIISLKLNATIMACSQAVVLPATRMVQLSDDQMKEMMEGMGGSYLRDYMAATREEANENFPNILMMVDPDQGLYATIPMSVYDNYVAKNVLLEDLNRIKFYLLNNTTVGGRPNMGMYVENTNGSHGVTESMGSASNEGGITGNQQRSTEHTTRASNNAGVTETQQHSTAYLNMASSVGQHTQGSPNGSSEEKQATFTHSSNISTPAWATTKGIPALTTDNGSTPSSKQTDKPTTNTSEGLQKNTSHSFSPTIATSTPSTSSSTLGSDRINGTGTSGGPLLSLSATTLDPEVQKSLDELNIYLGLGQSDVRSTLREVKTTISPNYLVRLADMATHNRKRNTDGTTTQENYCQPKGSPTDNKEYVHLCTSCAATTQLTDEFFPRYINEVVCKNGDTDCFKIGNTVHGKCIQRYFSLNMMRRTNNRCMVMRHNGESLVLDDWQLVQKRIRVSCECTINKNSFLIPYVSQDPVPVG